MASNPSRISNQDLSRLFEIIELNYFRIIAKWKETQQTDEEAFAYYDVESHRFVVEKGTFEILAGPSSADLPLKATVVL